MATRPCIGHSIIHGMHAVYERTACIFLFFIPYRGINGINRGFVVNAVGPSPFRPISFTLLSFHLCSLSALTVPFEGKYEGLKEL